MSGKRLFSALAAAAAAFTLQSTVSGHDYISYMLYFVAALILLFGIIGRHLKRIICIMLTVGVLYFAVIEIPIIRSSFGDNSCDADYIIVLGAAVNGDSPSLALTERLNAAKDYLDAHPACIAVVSGGKGGNENMSEAEVMYDWLISRGISPDRVIVEDRATSTYENLRFSFELIDDADAAVAIVSSEYHLYRAKLMADGMGHEVYLIPAHTTYPTVMANYFIREAFGVTYYLLTAS